MKGILVAISIGLAMLSVTANSQAANLYVESIDNAKECKQLMGWWDNKAYIGCLVFSTDPGFENLSLQQTCLNDDCGWTVYKRLGVHPVGKAQIGYSYQYTLLDGSSSDDSSTLEASRFGSNSVTITIESRKSTSIE